MKYKMSDVFELPVRRHYSAIIDRNGAQCSYMNQVDCAVHAINNHDRLTEQVAELKELLELAGGMGFNTVTRESSVTHRDYCKRVDKLLTRIGEDNE